MNSNIINDKGSGYWKEGFSVEKEQLLIFPTRIGRLKNQGILIGYEKKDFFVSL